MESRSSDGESGSSNESESESPKVPPPSYEEAKSEQNVMLLSQTFFLLCPQKTHTKHT